MERTSRLMAWLQARAPVAGDVGGLFFFAYWTTRSRGIDLPAVWPGLLDAATMVLVGIAVVGYQLAQGTKANAWIGWAAAATIAAGFGGSLALVCAGLAMFGLAIVRCGVHPRLPGELLVVGGVVLLFAQALAPGFGRADAGASPLWSAVMGIALVGVAGAMVDLDTVHRDGRPHATT